MAFKSNKQRGFYFANKNKNVSSRKLTTDVPKFSMPKLETVPEIKVPGLSKKNRWGRIKKNFKIGGF